VAKLSRVNKIGFLGVVLSGAAVTGALALLASTPSCGGKETTVTTDEFCSQVAAAECERTSALCGVSAASCQAARKPICTGWVLATQSATRAFHQGKIDACISKIKAIYAKDSITPTDLAAKDDACNRVFSGDVENFKPCQVDYDCQDGYICSQNVCAKPLKKNANDQCSDFGSQCPVGFFCTTAPGVPVKQCLPRKALMEPCVQTADCLEDLRCVNGACAARVGISTPCLSNDDCASSAPLCDPNLSPPKCQVGLRFATGAVDCNPFGGAATGTGGAGGGAAGGASAGGAGGT